MNFGKEIVFTIHNEIHKVSADKVGPETTLNEYLRENAGLKDTKGMCYEGGCGACVVSATVKHPVTKRERHFAVNSCLVPILACHDWNIITVEKIGNRRIGYHPIQKALAKFSGSQCGFCSGGMVMNMYSLLEENEYLSVKDVENSFGGSLCRCTGYRPIMDAFKSLCVDADKELVDKYPDIEDIVCPNLGRICRSKSPFDWDMVHDVGDKMIVLNSEEASWYKVYTINNILELFQKIGNLKYRFAAGNTAKGVYKIKIPPQVYIDITSVPELIEHKLNKNLVLGANISLTEVMNIMLKVSDDSPNFLYLQKFYVHIDDVAHVPVRNIGTLAGNLSIKHEHNEFPSDIFLLLTCVGAQLTIVQRNGSVLTKSLEEYLKFDMNKCFIKCITLPPLNKETCIFESYKITPRVQNAHAYVNAAFLIEFEKDDIVKNARIIFGGINPDFIHASETEAFLRKKHLFDKDTLQNAFKKLDEEVKPNSVIPDASPKFRKNLALALFYKFILKSAPKDKINPKNVSGGTRINRPLSYGTQDYSTDKKMYPLTQPVQKIEGLIQCSGEIQYINDIPPIENELYGAFVLANTMPLSTIQHIDTTQALAQPEVVAFITYKDIPGINSFTPPLLSPSPEEIFCSGKVAYNGQAIGLILAETNEKAISAAELVKVTYTKNEKQPLFNIKEVLKSNETGRIKNVIDEKPKTRGNDIKQTIRGTFEIDGQYHFSMETQCAICIPTDDGGFDIYSATQWIDHVHMAVSQALKLPQNKINISVRRLGGAYGAKLARATLTATACAVASNKLNRPVRIKLPLTTNMELIGKRVPTYASYEVGVNENGVIQYLDNTFYHDQGTSGNNELSYTNTVGTFKGCYNIDTWHISANVVQTDMAGNSWCRAPGSVEGVCMIEHIMEHISMVTKKDSLQVRLANIPTSNTVILDFINEVLEWSEYDKKKTAIEEFNQRNRWMKRGISFVIMNYPFKIFGTYAVLISIYSGDGTVAISHGGIECGQGINTKVVQVCAHMLKISMEMISIKATNNLITPNNMCTGGSITSEACCYATMEACNTLLTRLEPIRSKMNNPTWPELIYKAQTENVQLCATAMYSKNSDVAPYIINGVCTAEVEIDVLTGEHNIIQVDLLEDVGSSMSPEVDIGQIEGSFTMGIGYWTCENLIYDTNGALATNNTWTYKVPGVKEIPNDFRIRMKKNSKNPKGVFNSKAVGEPPLCLSCAIPVAIRKALASARSDSDLNAPSWTFMDGPTTVEFVFLNGSNDFKQFNL